MEKLSYFDIHISSIQIIILPDIRRYFISWKPSMFISSKPFIIASRRTIALQSILRNTQPMPRINSFDSTPVGFMPRVDSLPRPDSLWQDRSTVEHLKTPREWNAIMHVHVPAMFKESRYVIRHTSYVILITCSIHTSFEFSFLKNWMVMKQFLSYKIEQYHDITPFHSDTLNNAYFGEQMDEF